MLDYQHLAALAAVIRRGSFEAAAEYLAVTPSAVSQRIKLLEERMGAVLVVRDQPCRGTAAGQRLCQHLEQVVLLEEGLRDLLPGQQDAAPRVSLRLSINADSLATWFIPAMAEAGSHLFDLVIDDQDHSADWLRRGEVQAAVTGHDRPVRGCSSKALGALRYIATASPEFVTRWCPDGFNEAAARQAPCLTFNHKDMLQQRWLGQVFGRAFQPPTHWIPSPHGFVDAARAGIGWGMNPQQMVRDDLETGQLVQLLPNAPLDVPLYWQQSRLNETLLAPLARAVGRAAVQHLQAPDLIPD